MKDVLKNLKLNEGNLGIVLGVVVMVLAGLLLLNYFRSINRAVSLDQTSSTSTEQISTELEPTTTKQKSEDEQKQIEPRPGNEYVIQKGDSLWKISMKTYGTGYQWSKVYEANREIIGENPSLLTTGSRINLPDAQPIEHTVIQGDNLWDLSLKYCGTGTAWETISQANNLANPRLIEPGLVLRVSCK